MDYIKAASERQSVRTYDSSRSLSPGQLSAIAARLSEIPSPYSCGDISLKIVSAATAPGGEKLGTYGVVSGAEHFITVAMAPDKSTIVAAGMMAEQLVLQLTSQGLGTVWIGGTLKRSRFAVSAGLADDMILPAIIPFGYPGKARFLERVMKSVAGSRSRRPFESLFFDGSPATVMTPTSAGAMAAPLEMVRLAPSAVNAQPWRVVRVASCWHFYASHKEKPGSHNENMKMLDMGIALSHFTLACQQLGMKTHITPVGVAVPPDILVPEDWHYIATVEVE